MLKAADPCVQSDVVHRAVTLSAAEKPSAEKPTSERRKVSWTSVALLLFAVGSAASGQVLLKHGMTKASEGGGLLAVRAVTSPWVLLGLAVFAVSAVAWLATLSRVPLSVAYPFNALGYLGILGASTVILHERTNAWTWVGTGLVVLGLVLVVATRPPG